MYENSGRGHRPCLPLPMPMPPLVPSAGDHKLVASTGIVPRNRVRDYPLTLKKLV